MASKRKSYKSILSSGTYYSRKMARRKLRQGITAPQGGFVKLARKK